MGISIRMGGKLGVWSVCGTELVEVGHSFKETVSKPLRVDADDELLSVRDACALLKISRSQLFAMSKNRTDGFPCQIKLGLRTSRWSKKALLCWLSRCKRGPYGESEE